ncbi:MAG: hypothetical protein F9K46_02375 [Anaerolineae bacterium]|nr:MAG: hypothetical protein F9K46_02375 [Anaerolineae bacterium]
MMKISERLHKFHLHDSTINAFYFVPSEKRLILPIRLCDWDGDSEPDEIFGKTGLLIFHGVENFKTDPELTGLVWDQNFGLDVLDLDYQPELDSGEEEGVWGLFEFKTIPEEKYQQHILEITFTSTHFEWLETQQ